MKMIHVDAWREKKNFNEHKNGKQVIRTKTDKKVIYVDVHTVRNTNVHNLQQTAWQEVFLLFGK